MHDKINRIYIYRKFFRNVILLSLYSFIVYLFSSRKSQPRYFRYLDRYLRILPLVTVIGYHQ